MLRCDLPKHNFILLLLLLLLLLCVLLPLLLSWQATVRSSLLVAPIFYLFTQPIR